MPTTVEQLVVFCAFNGCSTTYLVIQYKDDRAHTIMIHNYLQRSQGNDTRTTGKCSHGNTIITRHLDKLKLTKRL